MVVDTFSLHFKIVSFELDINFDIVLNAGPSVASRFFSFLIKKQNLSCLRHSVVLCLFIYVQSYNLGVGTF